MAHEGVKLTEVRMFATRSLAMSLGSLTFPQSGFIIEAADGNTWQSQRCGCGHDQAVGAQKCERTAVHARGMSELFILQNKPDFSLSACERLIPELRPSYAP